MKRSLLLREHLAIALAVLIVLSGIVLVSFNLIKNVLINPYRYFSTDVLVADFQFYIVFGSFLIASILTAFTIYLILTLRTQAELMVLNAIKPLNISLEQVKRLYEVAPVPYFILNSKGEIIESNKAALRFFGVVEEEIIGKNIFFYGLKEDSEKIEKMLQYYKSDIPIDKEEIRMITKSGTIKWALLSVYEMKNPKSYDRTGLATIFDITEQKKLDLAKTEFVSLASHQLRAPVATIKWYMEMLLSGDLGQLSTKQNEYANIVNKSNEDMIDLIDTLLNISRIEIGSIAFEPKPTNVIELTESVLTELSPQIEEKGITINRQYDDNLKKIETDPKLLRIVIQNLISNAVKYTLNAGTITITFKESFMTGKEISIADTGIGIPENEQDKIFTKLFRADNARNLPKNQGTGLGLYLVKSIIETMGGKISFISKENEGSIFTVKF